MKNLFSYELFEKRKVGSGMEPVKYLTEITLHKQENPDVQIVITVDRMNRIEDVRSYSGVRHIFRQGSVLNKHQMERWMETNGFVEGDRRSRKKQLKGNQLMKFMMRRGYR